MPGATKRVATRLTLNTVRAGALLALLLTVGSANLGAQARVSGFVRDTSGFALAGVEVRVDISNLRVTSDRDGGFVLVNVPTGPARLIFRRLGFRPTALDLEVTASGLENLEVQMMHTAQRLTPVTVQVKRESAVPRLRGFYERMERRVQGHFISRERIARSHSFSFTDLLREVPGVSIRPIGHIRKAVRLRGSACPPLVFIDGFAASAAEFDLESLDPVMVEGIEIYPGSSSVPSEFLGPRGLEQCGVIAVWSRPAPGRQRQQPPASIPRERIDVIDLLSMQGVFTYQDVDSVAMMVEGSLAPVIPDSLLGSEDPARVMVEFVVDTTGTVIPLSVSVVSTSHPQLSASVRDAILLASFIPAIKDGKPVRQIVQVPLELDLSRRR